MQPYFDPTRKTTWKKMEDDLKKMKNGRWPKKKTGRWPPPKKMEDDLKIKIEDDLQKNGGDLKKKWEKNQP